MSIHRIRLRGPWNYQWLSSPAEQLPARGRATLPLAWNELFGEAGGSVRFQRTFHRPTNLEPETRVDLVFEGFGGEARIALNGRDLSENLQSPGTFPIHIPITDLLLPTNDLQVEIRHDPQTSPAPGGLWGTVALEITEASTQ